MACAAGFDTYRSNSIPAFLLEIGCRLSPASLIAVRCSAVGCSPEGTPMKRPNWVGINRRRSQKKVSDPSKVRASHVGGAEVLPGKAEAMRTSALVRSGWRRANSIAEGPPRNTREPGPSRPPGDPAVRHMRRPAPPESHRRGWSTQGSRSGTERRSDSRRRYRSGPDPVRRRNHRRAGGKSEQPDHHRAACTRCSSRRRESVSLVLPQPVVDVSRFSPEDDHVS